MWRRCLRPSWHWGWRCGGALGDPRYGDRDDHSQEDRLKTQYYTATSLDGFIATPDDSLDWLFPLGDPADTGYDDFSREVGALAMGSATYEWMLRHVLGPEASHPGPWLYAQPAWVFTTRSLPTVPDADITFVHGDVRPVHAEMVRAANGKNVWIVGGGDLVGQFHDAGLLDEIIAQVGSVTLGSGKPLLPRAIVSPPLRLTSARTIGTGFAGLRYEVPKRHDHPPTQPGDASDAAGQLP